jgi:hypothetical protein
MKRWGVKQPNSVHKISERKYPETIVDRRNFEECDQEIRQSLWNGTQGKKALYYNGPGWLIVSDVLVRTQKVR